MKTTKVYRGPGYPVDPKKQEVRVWRAVLESAFEMLPRPKPIQHYDFIGSREDCEKYQAMLVKHVREELAKGATLDQVFPL